MAFFHTAVAEASAVGTVVAEVAVDTVVAEAVVVGASAVASEVASLQP